MAGTCYPVKLQNVADTCLSLCTHIYTHVHTHGIHMAYTCVCTCAYTYVCACVWVCTCICVCAYPHILVCQMARHVPRHTSLFCMPSHMYKHISVHMSTHVSIEMSVRVSMPHGLKHKSLYHQTGSALPRPPPVLLQISRRSYVATPAATPPLCT